MFRVDTVHYAAVREMSRYVLVVAMAICAQNVVAQNLSQDSLRDLEAINRASQLEMERSQLRWKQQQLESDLMLERLRADTERLTIQNDARRAQELAAQEARRRAEEQAAVLQKAEEAAEQIRGEIEQASIRTKNNIYLGVVTFLLVGFSWYVVGRRQREKIMSEFQKFGVLVIVGSLLLMLFAIVLSEGWIASGDVLHNIFTSLRIQLFAENENCRFMCSYAIDLPTKYVVLILICGVAYGFTTYLGITPIPDRVKKILGESTDHGSAS